MSDNCYQKILDLYSSFPKQQKKIADFILTNISEVIYFPVARISQEIGVSNASVVRFAKLLGYDGFPDFREALFKYYKEMFSPSERVKQLIKDFENTEINYKSITEKEIHYLQKSITAIDEARFLGTVDLICRARKVHILGTGPNQMLGLHLAYRLRRFQIDVFHHRAGDMRMLDELLSIEENDLGIAYNFYRTADELKVFINVMKRNRVPVVLITDIMTPLIIKDCEHVLCAERGPHGAFHSPLVPMAITNALLIGVAHKLDKKAIDALDLLETYRQDYYYKTGSDKNEA